MDKTLIEQVVRAVIASMQDLGPKVAEQKPCLLLVHGKHRAQAEVEEIAGALMTKWQVRTISFDSPDLGSAANDISRAVLIDIEQDLLVRGALGLTDSPPSELLAHVLQNGIPVTLVLAPTLARMLQSVPSDDKLPEPAKRYRQHIRKHRDTLVSFGAKFANLYELEEDNAMTLHFNGQVLTHFNVQDTDVTTIVVSQNSLITPLARDTAKEKGITLLFK